ncbi:hypothetical protein RCL1_006858 [Eukaryota sp. TZLM3-RCL]
MTSSQSSQSSLVKSHVVLSFFSIPIFFRQFPEELTFLRGRTAVTEEHRSLTVHPFHLFSGLSPSNSLVESKSHLPSLLSSLDVMFSEVSEVVIDFIDNSGYIETLIQKIARICNCWPSSGAINMVILALYVIANTDDPHYEEALRFVMKIASRRGILSIGVTSIRQYKVSRLARALELKEKSRLS